MLRKSRAAVGELNHARRYRAAEKSAAIDVASDARRQAWLIVGEVRATMRGILRWLASGGASKASKSPDRSA